MAVRFIKTVTSYRAVNTLRLGYKNQSFNAGQRNNRCLFTDPYKACNPNYLYIQISSPYRAVKKLCLGYKNQSVNAV